MNKVYPILALKDNYIWCIASEDKKSIIVDPGEAKPVIDFLEKNQLQLIAMLITHHHYDHTNGIKEILTYKHVPVWGAKKIIQVTNFVTEGDILDFPQMNSSYRVISIPGHTLEHIAYYNDGMVLTGDTLFTAGCGRIFEGTVQQMYSSLEKLKQLPEDTLIYCGHEYTENNLKFAKLVEPLNKDIQQRIETTHSLRLKNLPTVPATLSLEKKTNPFLRCEQSVIMSSASNYCKKKLTDPIKVLGVLREWKNQYN